MTIYLQDLERDEMIKADLTVSYSVPCQDLFAAFSTDIQGPARKAREYACHRVIQLVSGRFKHAGQLYEATFGFFLSGHGMVPVLMDGVCVDGEYSGFGFAVSQDYYGHCPTKQALFHFPAIPSLLGEEPLTFLEASALALEGDHDERKAYALSPADGLGSGRLVDHGGFSEHMESRAAAPQAV